MTYVRQRCLRDERGASLILVIAFMLIIGAITSALLPSITSGLNDRNVLDQARNREYAADGLIEYAIARARTPVALWDTSTSSVLTFVASANSHGCGGPYAPSLTGTVPPEAHLDNVDIRVECTPAPALALSSTAGSGFAQRNAIFIACSDPGSSGTCANSPTIVRAQVNFSDSGLATVQAWSVNA